GEMAIVERAVPRPGPGEALLRIRYAGICGSDLQTYAGTQPFASYPRVPGHEFSAEVVKINGDERGFAEGMLVTGNPYFNCGNCYSCRRGLINCCEHNQTMGVHRDGSFQEYIVMPVDRLHSAEGVDAQVAAMIEPFTIGWHAMTRAAVGNGHRVIILGAGAIGILAMVAAKVKGAEVFVADILPERLNTAISMGAAEVYNLRETSIAQAVEAATSGDGFDVVGEATGVPASFINAVEASAFGGTVALIGNGSEEVTFNHSQLIKKELNVVGARNSLDAFDPLVELLRRDAVDITPIRTAVHGFEDAVEVMEDLSQRPARNIKVLLEF